MTPWFSTRLRPSEVWLRCQRARRRPRVPAARATPCNDSRAWYMPCSRAPSVRRVRGAGCCGALVLVLVLVVVVVVVAGTARAEEDGPLARDAPEGPGRRPGLSARRPATRWPGTPST